MGRGASGSDHLRGSTPPPRSTTVPTSTGVGSPGAAACGRLARQHDVRAVARVQVGHDDGVALDREPHVVARDVVVARADRDEARDAAAGDLADARARGRARPRGRSAPRSRRAGAGVDTGGGCRDRRHRRRVRLLPPPRAARSARSRRRSMLGDGQAVVVAVEAPRCDGELVDGRHRPRGRDRRRGDRRPRRGDASVCSAGGADGSDRTARPRARLDGAAGRHRGRLARRPRLERRRLAGGARCPLDHRQLRRRHASAAESATTVIAEARRIDDALGPGRDARARDRRLADAHRDAAARDDARRSPVGVAHDERERRRGGEASGRQPVEHLRHRIVVAEVRPQGHQLGRGRRRRQQHDPAAHGGEPPVGGSGR